jgi:D-aspartate ligase
MRWMGERSWNGKPAAARRRVGAVVVGGDYQGLGIVRSLGRFGVPICVVDDELSIARFSRYTTTAVRVRRLRSDEDLLETLGSAQSRFGIDGWLLFPTRDETVAAISRNRDVLTKRFRVPTPSWDTVRWACDKRNTYRLAEELGIPIPRTWFLEGNGIPPDLVYPVVLKPAIKEHFLYATKTKAWRADSEADLRARLAEARRIVPVEEVMLQELIPGDGRHQFAFCSFFSGGRSLGRMTVRRARQHPPLFGRSSTFVETIDLPELQELSERFLRRIDYYGLVEVEYKLDARTGQHKLLDVNARTWGYHSIGPRAGVDFVRQLYLDQVGEAVEQQAATTGITWIRLSTDVPTGFLEVVRGRMKPTDYVASLRQVNTESVFSADDWSPGVAEMALIPYLAMRRGF